MKRLAIAFFACLAVGGLALLLSNSLGFVPLNQGGRDPNSNAAILGIVYFVLGGILIGAGSGTGGRNLLERVQYLKAGYKEDLGLQLGRFPVGILLCLSGLLFVALYFVLNSLTIR